MKKNIPDIQDALLDDEHCIEWIKNQRYPDGIRCPTCNKVTKHHKLINCRCYSCDNCGSRVYPTAGTMFHKSRIPLTFWFEVINKIKSSPNKVTAKAVQREYGMTYKTAWRMVHTIKEYLKGNIEMFPDLNMSGNNIEKYPLKNIGEEVSANFQGSSDRPLTKRTLQINQIKEKDVHRKRDRTARLLRLQIFLWQNPQGLTIQELSRKCMTSKRTVYRDLQTIESELNIPIWEQGKIRGIVEGVYLPPIAFSLEEAFYVFIASRLIQKLTHSYSPFLNSTFMKISAIIPPYLRNKIQDSMEFKERAPMQEGKIRNLRTILHAWLTQHRIKILYRDEYHSETKEIIIEPYFIEPIISVHSIFVIAYCPSEEHMYSYNIDRIIGDAVLCADTYEIPLNFNPITTINSAWGLPDGNEILTIKVRFKSNVSQIIMSTIWHPSQIIECQSDGSLIAIFKVRNISGFRSWLLSWGDEAEVLEPKAFREEIISFVKNVWQVYSK